MPNTCVLWDGVRDRPQIITPGRANTRSPEPVFCGYGLRETGHYSECANSHPQIFVLWRRNWAGPGRSARPGIFHRHLSSVPLVRDVCSWALLCFVFFGQVKNTISPSPKGVSRGHHDFLRNISSRLTPWQSPNHMSLILAICEGGREGPRKLV
jgi:hypothetical protein